MDSSPSNENTGTVKAAGKSSIDSLRTVEFRVTIRGYHMDDVDEYLERVAAEAEALQEQVRLSGDRLKAATDRVTSLEQQLEAARRAQPSSAPVAAAAPLPAERVQAEVVVPTDDALQRTLLLAQRFVDQTKMEAEQEAHALISESESRANGIIADAEEHVRSMTEEAERNLRDEVKRLELHRTELVSDVETIARHLETERARIRKALSEMLAWVDEHVQPPASSGTHQVSSGGGGSPQISERKDPPRPAISSEQSRSHRGDSGSATQPTEQVPATSSILSDPSESDDPTAGLFPTSGDPVSAPTSQSASPRASERAATHQRQMFGTGRDSHQAGTAAPR
jgi:cell division initiation protein